ncbi:hypothetical protein V474_13160 [Novosphingobium barchaimii LL02]|uniref:Nitrate reductase n=1 Tax=Novosphingobium barchaimii LL02 TaxID=1114963 RepID=A0A0J7XW81_9SPHN|nr:nucleotidyltransferase family protein [Novosphingobium barchaimii]KMS55971.1 hypothetical protein V474_13160 [Novosphingobium barchaimii LL02]
MAATSRISSILRADPLRWHLLGVVEALNLPDCWIGAGFVRNAVWDHLHQRSIAPPNADVDVIWYDPDCADAAEDRKFEAHLLALEPSITWSVKNQARMHGRNGDAPYASATDAMRYWPETATAVAARRRGSDGCDIAAPFGLDDLLDLVLRPTSRFRVEKRTIYEDRIRTKGWFGSWPLLTRAEG